MATGEARKSLGIDGDLRPPQPSGNGTYSLGQLLESDGLSAVDRNLECQADLSHSYAAQCTDPLDQHCG